MEAYVTEVRALQAADSIKVFFYHFAVEDQQARYEGAYSICATLRWKNLRNAIAYKESCVMSLLEINDMDTFTPVLTEHRTIDPTNDFERRLLERLIKESLLTIGQRTVKLKRVASDLQKWKGKKVGTIVVYPAMSLHVNISDNRIHIGFNVTHKFEYAISLQQMIEQQRELHPDMEVVDTTHPKNYTYYFEKIADYGVYDTCPIIKKSIAQYYEDKQMMNKVKVLSAKSKVIYVKTKDGQRLIYAADILKPVCSFQTMTSKERLQVMNHIKLKPLERMNQTLQDAEVLLNYVKYLSFEEQPFLAKENGYTVESLLTPKVYFNQVFTKPLQGLKKGKLYRGGKMTMSIFLDETIIHEPLSKMIVFQYVSVLQYIALQHGVEMTINQQTQVMKGKITEAFFEQFAWEIKEHERIFKDTTVLAILSEPHLHVYEPLKKQFGGKWDISSQVISEERIKEFYKILQQHHIASFNPTDKQQVQRAATIIQNERSLPYTFYNVLLGLYVKSGMQPWVLHEKTYSDCFIGLDVSHEKGKSTAGIINVIGNDGRLMKQAAMNGTNVGEKISQELLKEVLEEVMHLYKTEYNGLPTHMTIHRDGFWREDTQTVTDFLHHLHISFDIVEIIKEPNRRMAYYNHVSENYETRQGTYYQRNQEALLCATDPREQVGMAKPLKVIQKTTTLPFEQIIHDVYMLSFMHIHALNKTRLPITTHYADLSSTFYQRGMLVPKTTNETNLPFV